MSWIRIWVHLVFSTKNRIPYFDTPELRQKVYQHIKENAAEKNIWLDSVNGHKEHIHCLVSLGKTQSISTVAQLIKGESSIWFNRSKFKKEHFNWQDDYWAVGVSEGHLPEVRNYIRRQEEHHKVKTFAEEIEEFMNKYGWSIIKEGR